MRKRACLRLGLAAALGVGALVLTGCIGKPEGVEPVSNFDSSRYLGKWYEIARLDQRFERGLSQVSAEYSLRDDGGLKVLNRGYKADGKQWKESTGKAYFVDKPSVGHLKVSFFGPFYGSYIVTDLDPDYRYCLVSGNDKSSLWLLARTPTIGADVKKRLLDKAQALGFDTSKLIWVDQSMQPAQANQAGQSLSQ
jgi:apolipoprotein D and lipocalin family protein